MNIQTEEEKGFLSTKNNIASIIDSKNNNGIRVRGERKKTVPQRINPHNHKYFSMPKRQNIEVKYKNKITDENKIADKTKKNANSNNKKIEHKGGREKNVQTEERDRHYMLFAFNQKDNVFSNNKVLKNHSAQKTKKQIKNMSLIVFPLNKKYNSISKIKNKK